MWTEHHRAPPPATRPYAATAYREARRATSHNATIDLAVWAIVMYTDRYRTVRFEQAAAVTN